MDRPLLLVVSAPSGAGKTTLCNRLRRVMPRMVPSISCTTRDPRGQEVDGVHYHFLRPAEFRRRVRAGALLEHAFVHGHHYGTLRATVRGALKQGRDVLLVIDVQGARKIRQAVRRAPERDPLKRAFVDIFIAPPSLAALRARLRKRGEDTPGAIAQRLKNAEREMRCQGEYRHRIVNDDLKKAFRELLAVVRAEHARVFVE